MNWLTNFVRPKLKQLVKRDVPEDFWHKCPSCEHMIFHRDLEANLSVCQQCGHHLRLGAKKRLEMLFDEGKYQRIELPTAPLDPLKFRDQKRYTDRLKEARSKTQEEDAIIVAHGTVGNLPVVVAVLNFDFMGGSMGAAVGEGLIAAARLAVVQQAPLIAVTASGGARMQEGAISLMQLPRTVIAVQEVKEAALPYIVVLTDPTTGGVSASFAMLGDIHIAEKGAMIGFAGARVIEQTVRETLPEEFQKAEYLLDHGMVDIVTDRGDLRDCLIRILTLLRQPSPPADLLALPRSNETSSNADATKPASNPSNVEAPRPD